MAAVKKVTATKTAASATIKASASKKGQKNVRSSVAPARKAQSLYMQLLSVSSEAKELQELQYHIEDKLSQFNEDLRQTNRALAAAKREREELISSKSLTADALSRVDQKIEGLQKGANRLESYIAELF